MDGARGLQEGQNNNLDTVSDSRGSGWLVYSGAGQMGSGITVVSFSGAVQVDLFYARGMGIDRDDGAWLCWRRGSCHDCC